MKPILVAVALMISHLGFAHEGPMDRLQYLNEAREAANRKFLAVIEVGAAKNDIVRAEYSYGLVLKLAETSSVSAFELSNAKMKVMTSKFAEKRAQYHVVAADIYIKLAKLRLDVVETGKEPNKEVVLAQAKHHLDLCEKRHALIVELDKALVPFAAEVKFQNDAIQRLTATRAVSAEEAKKMEVYNDDVMGLAKVTKAELEASLEAKKQAEKEARG